MLSNIIHIYKVPTMKIIATKLAMKIKIVDNFFADAKVFSSQQQELCIFYYFFATNFFATKNNL